MNANKYKQKIFYTMGKKSSRVYTGYVNRRSMKEQLSGPGTARTTVGGSNSAMFRPLGKRPGPESVFPGRG
jgi:hypothetical protein